MLAGSGGRTQPHPDGRGVPLDVDLRQQLVIAEGAAEQGDGDDRHPLGAQPSVLDVGAMHTDQRGDRDAEHAAEGLGLPAEGGQGSIKAVVVVPNEPVAALVDLSPPLLGVDDEHSAGTEDQVVEVGGRAGHGQVMKAHIALAAEAGQQPDGVALAFGAALPGPGLVGGVESEPPVD
jgi:hypothetical protein